MFVLSSSVARADIIELVCKRNDVANPMSYYLTINTSGSTVKGGPGLDDQNHPAQISSTAVSYSFGGFSWQVDRLSGRMIMVTSSGTRVEFNCKKAQGF
jgi:hypothetical protein